MNNNFNSELIKSHIEPQLYPEFSSTISTKIIEPYAMMDTSDGLCDALFKIAEASDIKIQIDYDMIPHMPEVNKHQVLFGGEDYNLVAVIPSKYSTLIPSAVLIGKAVNFDGTRVEISGEKYNNYNQLRVFNHFGENNE